MRRPDAMPRLLSLAKWTTVVKGQSKWTENKTINRQDKEEEGDQIQSHENEQR